LVIVLLVLVALAAIVVPLVSGTRSDAEETTTKQTLTNVRDAVIQYWLDAPKEMPARLHFLFVDPDPTTPFDPNYKVGWRGPYLSQATGSYQVTDLDTNFATGTNFTSGYGQDGDKTVLDAWGNPVVLQDRDPGLEIRDVRVISAGPNGRIDIDATILSENLTDATDGDDLYVAFTLR